MRAKSEFQERNHWRTPFQGTYKGRSIDMGRIKIGSPNKVPTTEVLVVSDNLEPEELGYLYQSQLVGVILGDGNKILMSSSS